MIVSPDHLTFWILMNVLILAAGYATRLGDLTRNFPKPLLEVGGRSILDHLMERVDEIPGVKAVYLVTNSRYVGHFQRWQADRAEGGSDVTIIDDGTTTNDNRLGAIGDIRFVLREERPVGDILVCASDNILEFSLADFVAHVRERGGPGICVRRISDANDLRRRGVAELDDEDRVVRFVEKPQDPPSQWAAPPIYFDPAAVLPRIEEYLEAGGNSDAPGHFIEWLASVETVHAYRTAGEVVDIGNPESLQAARQRYG